MSPLVEDIPNELSSLLTCTTLSYICSKRSYNDTHIGSNLYCEESLYKNLLDSRFILDGYVPYYHNSSPSYIIKNIQKISATLFEHSSRYMDMYLTNNNCPIFVNTLNTFIDNFPYDLPEEYSLIYNNLRSIYNAIFAYELSYSEQTEVLNLNPPNIKDIYTDWLEYCIEFLNIKYIVMCNADDLKKL